MILSFDMTQAKDSAEVENAKLRSRLAELENDARVGEEKFQVEVDRLRAQIRAEFEANLTPRVASKDSSRSFSSSIAMAAAHMSP